MEMIARAIDMAMQRFREEYGEDAKLEEGDEFVTVFNDCVLIISFDEGRLQTDFIDGKPFEVDMALGIYEDGVSER